MNGTAQYITTEWARSFSGVNQEAGKAIATDLNGNVYTTGYFTGSIDLDPGVATLSVNSSGLQDIFISKLDLNGNLIWAKKIGGLGNDIAYSITIDNNGSIYLTGAFHNVVDFDPGAGMQYLYSASSSSQDIFILKLDTSGNFIWVKSFEGSGYYDAFGNLYDAISTGYGVQTDTNGNVICTGGFLGALDFDPGAAIYTMSSLSVSNVFIVKLDSLGNFIWARSMGENKKGDEAYSIAVDHSGNIYTTGVFADTADFDPGPNVFNLITTAYTNVFVTKLDPSGNLLWAKKLGGNTLNDQATGFSIKTDNSNNVYLSGIFKGVGDFDPGIGIHTLTSSGNYDVFLCKINTAGDFVWAKNFGGSSADYCYSLAVDDNENVFATGSFKGTINVDIGNTNFSLSSTPLSTQDIFILKLNASGQYLWAGKVGGTGNDLGTAISVSQGNHIFMTGYYSNTADFSVGNNPNILTGLGSTDAFALKLGQGNIVLPLLITDFSVTKTSVGNLLKWQTENELSSSSGFIIERGKNAINFHEAGRVSVREGSCHYNFLDEYSTSGITYYRLKTIGQDNHILYSEILTLYSENMQTAKIYPNPSNGEINIQTEHPFSGIVRLRNQQGQIVVENKISQRTFWNCDLSSFKNGLYFFEGLENNGKDIIFRTVVQLIK